MTQEEILVHALCGAFEPNTTAQSNWLQPFTGSNIEPLFKIIVPGEEMQCISHDSLFMNNAAKQDLVLDYVPVQGSKPIFGDEAISGPVTHYFVTRPLVIRGMTKLTGLMYESCNIGSVMIMWNHIAYALRQMLQRKHGGAIQRLPFSDLLDFGVDATVVRQTLISCANVCLGDKLEGEAELAYMDRCSISTLVTHTVMQQGILVITGQSKAIDFRVIAEAVMRGCPK